ncbi:MAG TPA: cytochrome c biogenesis protein CcsA [Gemmataceae bacterium]|jgi:ABC-type transport system involved in cytochrome c biogenesis permease subunit|nr:cytochrome c biogenesis protein CcsA [Gemmataceae bacterium]
MPLDRVTIFCFAASYSVAWLLELALLWAQRPALRYLATFFGAAGLLAHTIYFVMQRLTLDSQAGSLLFLAWILATFYLYGSLHYRRLAWGLFVLPVVIGLIGLAQAFGVNAAGGAAHGLTIPVDPAQFWNFAHITLFLLAAVGVSVAFVASIMYLVQSRRLKTKTLPGNGVRLLNLERLENMNRRGINWAFPLLTIGLVIGLVQMAQDRVQLQGWTDPRVLSTIVLWIVFAIVLYLRYGFRLRGKRVAFLTIMAFALLLVTLVTAHQHKPGGIP